MFFGIIPVTFWVNLLLLVALVNFKNFVKLKSNSALKSNKVHNLLKSEITALIASLVSREFKQAIISSQEDKQGNKFKEGAIQCCKEKNYFPS